MTKRPPNAFSLLLIGEKKKKKKVKKYCLTEIQKTLYFIPNKLLVKNLTQIYSDVFWFFNLIVLIKLL